jgi:hypothetical protein
VTVGTLSLAGRIGVNRIAFQGRISRSKELRSGAYTVLITASNSTGTSNEVRLGFVIVKGGISSKD